MKLPSLFSSIAILLLSTSIGVNAFWRILCHGTLGTARIDPIVNFGKIAPHAHHIAGGSNFGIFTNATNLLASNCTSCNVAQDKSAYWSPALYFEHDNGTYELVTTAGGMTVYYFNDNYGLLNETDEHVVVPAGPLVAFPQDFRMVAGNTSLRNFPYSTPDRDMSFWEPSDMTQEALAAKALGFNCLHYHLSPNEGSMQYHHLRNKTFLDANCPDGVRFEIEFPSCWDGVRLDSEDHKSHILYPNLIKTGKCPDGFDVRTPVMFFETIWNTQAFVGQSGQFAIANGDTEGYGYHADFYSAWDETVLQNAINTCTNGSGLVEDCPLFNVQDDSISTSCFLNLPQELEQEDTQGPLPTLPGNVPICTGPEPAAKMKGTPVSNSTILPGPSTLASDLIKGANSTIIPSAYATSAATYNSISEATSASFTTAAVQASVSNSTTISPTITAAPTTGGNDEASILYTTVFTSESHEIHLVMFEDVVTVTDGVHPTKRHLHKHANLHRHGRD